MNKNLALILLISVILLASGCTRTTRQKPDATPTATTAPSADANSVVNAPGRYDQTIQVGDATREFIVYVPELAGGAAQVPLVVMLHGTSGTGDEFYGKSGWREKADKEGFIVVFPTALAHCYHEDENFDGIFDPSEQKVFTKWGAGNLGERLPLCTEEEIAALAPEKRALTDHPLADDVAFFHSMFDFLEANYSIDSKRIYVTGFSSGGQMAGRLSVEMSERIAAGAAHAAQLSVSGPSARPISVIVTYGNADDSLVLLNNGNPFPLEEALIQHPQIQALLVERWLAALQLADVYEYSEGTISGERYVQFTYTTSTIGADNLFQVIFIDNMTHEYPNGKNHPVTAANILWEFFTQYQLP